MKVFIVISTLIFLSGFIVLVVFTVLTLIQIRNTANEAEQVLKKINKNLDNVTVVSDEIKKVVSASVPIFVSIITGITSGIFGMLKNLIFRRGK